MLQARLNPITRLTLTTAIAVALATSLSACSGGGSNVKGTYTPPPPPAPAPPTSTPPPPPAGGSSDYSYPAYSHLVPTGAIKAQKEGFTGKGVKVGVLDSGVDTSVVSLKGRVASFKSYITAGSDTPNDTTGHGSTITQSLGGSVTDGFVGGVAPDTSLYFAQVCDKNNDCELGGQPYSDLSAQGVKLFNQSFGTMVSSPAADLNASEKALYQPLVDAGALFVWAAGNEGADKLAYQADLPHYVPSLQKGWLAVVNLQIDDSGNPDGLDSTSARCGEAGQWCLAAPGTLKTLPVKGSEFSSGLSDGTSDATAVVTGVAAQVWQAFPWMTGSDVQQTLLTTAKHLGPGTGPNTTYGWGLVNAADAVHGPEQFAFGAFSANIGTFDSEFSNPISGDGSLVLDGSTGTLTLSADNTYAGGTTINGGTLELTGALGSQVTVNGGVLAGDGTIHGNLTNAAMMTSVGATPGQGLSVDGDYTASKASTTAIALGNPLTVGGTATVDGTLEILAPTGDYTPKATETLVTTGAGLNGTFADETYGDSVFYKASLNYTADTLTADITRTSVSMSIPLPATAQKNAAKGIDKALDTADEWASTGEAGHATFLKTAASFLTAHTQSQALASVTSLDGEIYGTTSAIEAQQAQTTDNALQVRQNRAVSGNHPDVWVQAVGESGALSKSGLSSAKYNQSGALFGIDTQILPQIHGGIALGRTKLRAHLDGLAGHVDGRENTVGLYARYNGNDGTYVAGRAFWSNERVTVRRDALIGDSLQRIGGVRNDGVARATFEVGHSYDMGRAFLTPYLSAGALRLDQEGFTESGGAGFGLTAHSRRHTATLASVGLRFGRGIDWTGGHSVLSGYVAYRRVLSGADMGFTASLSGAPDATFTAEGQGLARNTGRVGVTFTTQAGPGWGWFVNAEAQAARGRSHDVSANAGIRIHF